MGYDLNRLVTLRSQVLEDCRADECLRFLQAFPLADGNTLGGLAHECNSLSTAIQLRADEVIE
jgi:hypothetical protein